MRKKGLQSAAALAVLALGLSACGIHEEVVVQEENRVILTVLAGQSTSDAGIEDMIDEALKKRFPQVQLQWECVDWGEQFGDLMQARISAGDIPDLMVGKAQDVHTFEASGNLAEISPECISRIEDRALEAVTVDGKVYGVPYNAWYQGVIYNKGIFRKWGLEVPKTLQELEQVIRTLEENGVTPFAAHFQESWKVGNMTMQFLMNEVFCREADWGEAFRRGDRSFQGDERVRACLEQNRKILEHSWEDALLIDQFESDNRFSQGEAAMYLTGSWSMQFTAQYSGDQEFGIFPYPNEEGDASLIRETNMTFLKSAKSEQGELVDEILEYLLTDQELVGEILDFTQAFSVVKDTTPEVENVLQEDIEAYEASGRVVDVTLGNAQLIWPFQNDVAGKQLLWLQGNGTLEEVLAYADEHRMESGY